MMPKSQVFEPPDQMFYGAIIQYLKAHGVSQADIAKRLGVSQPTVSMWATNTRPLSERHHEALWSLFREVIEQTADPGEMWRVLAKSALENTLHEDALYEQLAMLHSSLRPYIEMDAAKLKEVLTPAVRGALLETYGRGASILKYLNREDR
jgi:transcriptional regulator with XRE-family HTH domain